MCVGLFALYPNVYRINTYRQNAMFDVNVLVANLPIMWYNTAKKTCWEVTMEYVSVAKMAEKWGLSERSVRNYCAHGRIADATV